MKMTHMQSLYQLTFLPGVFPVNCYLVEEEDGLTLIDAALPYSAKAILEAAGKIGKPITRILLTHAHGDHVGALDNLKQTLQDVPVYISERDARLLRGDVSLDKTEPDTPIRGGVPKSLKTREDFTLKDGDRAGSLLCISTPGHTPGSMSFLDTRNRTLIAGDALQIRGGIAVSGKVRPLFPFPAMGTWNKQVSIESAEKLTAYDPAILAVGHGRFLPAPAVAMRRAIEAARKH
ncbi:MBL fold metallo-hydrolase [Peribacillus sp. B-H-3]|uniref:MBL fold metallo-hydrolase n=1 Tax=Peribacillus sp. B-H-3 TaxID=3400420 RepID=UPI003B016F73